MQSVSVHAPSFTPNLQGDETEYQHEGRETNCESLSAESEGRWSSPQRYWATVKAALDDIKAQDKLKFGQGQSFVICDYGAAEGSTSMNLIRKSIAYVKEQYSRQQSIIVIHEDQSLNDFNSLVKTLTANQPISSYLNENVFTLISPIGFYAQCVADNTVHLGCSHFCLSYLSRVPCRYPVNTTKFGPAPDTEGFAKYQEQADSDWQLFLRLRAAELASGGQLILVSTINAPQYNDKPTQEIWLLDCWKQLATEGIISDAEYSNLCLPFYRRTEEEFRKPFCDENSSVCKAGLRLVSLETYAHRVGYETLSGSNDDKRIAQFAQHMMTITRCWCNGWFAGALSDRQANDREAVLETLFDRFRRRLAAEHSHCSYYSVVNMHITKV